MSQGRGRLVLLAVAVVLPLAGCSGGPDESPTDLLARAKTTLDDTTSVHFTLGTADEPQATTGLLGGEGDLLRPASFQGTLQVLVAGAAVDVEVVSVDGTVYAKLPFTSGFTVVDPADFGIGDPAALLDPDEGISQFLSSVEDPEMGEERRVDGEVVREVTGRVAVHPLGLDGDVQVNRRHHGGEGQAVYAYAQEDAEFWIAELDAVLPYLPDRARPKVAAAIEDRAAATA